MIVIVKFFGILQEQVPAKEKRVQIRTGMTVGNIYRTLSKSFPEKRFLPKILFAVNQEFVKSSHILKDGDELALIPPMSGG